MSDLTVQIVDCETGVETVRDMNTAEIKQYELDKQESINRKARLDAEADAKAALLVKLGITADEAKLLLG